jgi:seryl-tRNA(Sec) selenium transferase
MMVPGSTPNRPELSADSIAALKSALNAYAVDNDLRALQSALRLLASEAREKAIHAEQLLVVLKDAWFSLPQVAQAPQGDEQNRQLQRVVTVCIREYYSD